MRGKLAFPLALLCAWWVVPPASAEVLTLVVGVHSSCPYGLIP